MANVEVKFTKIFINNEWHDSVSGKTFATINPETEQKICDVQEGDKADVDKAVDAACNAFKFDSTWRQMDASKRGLLLYRLADLLQRDMDYLSKLETMDSGKPISITKMDIQLTINILKYYGGYADKIYGKVIPCDGNQMAYTLIQPVGVCGQIIPWNFPILMFGWKIGPALCSGCTVVLKPAEQTPLSALYLCHLIKEAGFPPGVVNVVPGFGPTAGAAITSHPKIDKIAFTGSTEVGKIIMKCCAEDLKRVTLELGGKSPFVVSDKLTNMDQAVFMAQQSCFYNIGQCCCAGSRTYVHESIYDEFVKKSIEFAKGIGRANLYEMSTGHGPQIDEEQMNKILSLIESGKKQGAKCVIGGEKMEGKGYYVQPTIFTDVTDDMDIARKEIFGPVQQIMKYKTLDEVIDRCNDTDYGLAAFFVSSDINEITKFTSRVRAGTVWVNTFLQFPGQVPFGGFKQSGIGREMGEEGLRGYGEVKSVIIRTDMKY